MKIKIATSLLLLTMLGGLNSCQPKIQQNLPPPPFLTNTVNYQTKPTNTYPIWLKFDWSDARAMIKKTRIQLEKKDPEILHRVNFEFGNQDQWVQIEILKNLKSMESAMASDGPIQFKPQVWPIHQIPVNKQTKQPSTDLRLMGTCSNLKGNVVITHPDLRGLPKLDRRRSIVHQIAHIAAGNKDHGYTTQIHQRDWYRTSHGPTRLTLNERLENADSYTRLIIP